MILVILGYLIGCINLSYLFSKMRGYDIREHGSKNAGASNVIILMGKKAGVIVAIVDILKAYVVVRFFVWLFPELSVAGALAGMAVILGHIFPFYMNFRGGKGFASIGGTILALDYRMFLIMLLMSVFVAFVTDYICFAPMSVALIFPATHGFMQRSALSALILYVASIFIWYRHIENLKRIKNGTELKFSFLWNRKAEAKRFGVAEDDGKNYPFFAEQQTEDKCGK